MNLVFYNSPNQFYFIVYTLFSQKKSDFENKKPIDIIDEHNIIFYEHKMEVTDNVLKT